MSSILKDIFYYYSRLYPPTLSSEASVVSEIFEQYGVVVKWGPPGFGAPHPQITRDLGLGGPHTTRVMGTP